MSYNGSGGFTIPNTFAPNTVISSSQMNANFADIANNGFGNTITKDGQQVITAQLKGFVSSNPCWSFNGDLDTGFGSDAADTAFIKAGGVKIFEFTQGRIIGGTPVGTVDDFAGSTAPSGWLLCFGQAVSRTTYAALFTALGTTYGAGDGSTTFNLPDVRGRVIAGKDDMGGSSANRLTNQSGGLNGDVLGAAGGVETHTLLNGQVPNTPVTVSVNNPPHAHTGSVGLQSVLGGSGGGTATRAGGSTPVTVDAATTNITASGTVQGSNQAHNNVQPTIIFNKIIFTGVYV